MPVIFTEQSDFEHWLADEDVKPLLRPLPDDALTLRAVRDVVNSPKNDDPRCLEDAVEVKQSPSLFGD